MLFGRRQEPEGQEAEQPLDAEEAVPAVAEDTASEEQVSEEELPPEEAIPEVEEAPPEPAAPEPAPEEPVEPVLDVQAPPIPAEESVPEEPPKADMPEDPRIEKLRAAYEAGKISKELYEKNLAKFKGEQ
jgi:hypothetical protein